MHASIFKETFYEILCTNQFQINITIYPLPQWNKTEQLTDNSGLPSINLICKAMDT